MLLPSHYDDRRSIVIPLLLLLWAAAPRHVAADSEGLRPTWQCLPDETAVAVHTPNGKAVVEAVVQGTKLGQVLFSDRRKNAVAQFVEKEHSDDWTKFRTELAECGLTAEDLLQLFAGESGYAIVLDDDEDNPIAAGIAWLEPGPTLATRAYEAIGIAAEKLADDEHPVARIDFDIDGRGVMQLSVPSISYEYKNDIEWPDDYSELSEDEQDRVREKVIAAREESRVEIVSFRTVLVSTIGGRLLIVHSLETKDSDGQRSEAESLSAILARLIRSHNDAQGGFVSRLVDDAGIANASDLPGVVVLDLLGDSDRLRKFFLATAEDREASERVSKLLGADGIGPFAMKIAVDGSRWQSRFFLSLPEPRQGLVRLVDQPPLSPHPRAWVPASVVGYSQWSLDLGKAYSIVKSEVSKEFPDESASSFERTETQFRNFAQASLEEVLASLGHRHIVLSFEPEFGRHDDAADAERTRATERSAVVWQVEDEPLWSRLLQSLAPLAGMAKGAKFGEEQGFRGWRLKSETFEGGLFLGKGYLVYAAGPGVLEGVLSSLNNPPHGANALRGSELYKQAASIMALPDGIAFNLIDGNRYVKVIHRAMVEAMAMMDEVEALVEQRGVSDEEDTENAWRELAKSLLPTEEELEGVLGVIVTVWEVDEQGLRSTSVTELPLPE